MVPILQLPSFSIIIRSVPIFEYLNGDRTFKTTEKGMNFLRIHNRVQELTPVTPTLHSREEKVSFL